MIWPEYERAIKANNASEDIGFAQKWIPIFEEYLSSASSGNPDYYRVANELLLHLRDTGSYQKALKYSNMLLASNNTFYSKNSGTFLTNLQLIGLAAQQPDSAYQPKDVLEQIDKLFTMCRNSAFKDDLLGEFRILKLCAEYTETFDNDETRSRLIQIYRYMLESILSLSQDEYANIILPDLATGFRRFSADDYAGKIIRLHRSQEKINNEYLALSKYSQIDKILLSFAEALNDESDKKQAFENLSKAVTNEPLKTYNILQYFHVLNYLTETGLNADALVFLERLNSLYADKEDLFKDNYFKKQIDNGFSQFKKINKEILNESYESQIL